MATTFNWISLGVPGVDLDPIEGNNTAENAGALVGRSFGAKDSPLFKQVAQVTTLDVGGTAGALDMDNAVSADKFTTTLGGKTVTLTLDGTAVYDATVTYADGTIGKVSAVLAQDSSGNLFLAPDPKSGMDESVYEAKPILSLTLQGLIGDTYTGIGADRHATGWDDGYVDGSTSADLIDDKFVEAVSSGSDKVDNGDAGLPGTSGHDDYIRAGAGNDTVYANQGHDTIEGGTGHDQVFGGAGNDLIYGGDGSDSQFGGDGNDTLFSDLGDDRLSGEAGSDLLTGGTGNDSLFGGSEGDTLVGDSGNDLLDGGSGNDSVSGGTGNDTISAGDGNDNVSAGTGDDSVDSGSGSDTVYFGAGNDTVDAGAGADLIDDTAGGQDAGNNLIYGGSGNDTIWTGSGNDTVQGGADNDQVSGEDGDDRLSGEDGADTLFGGAGNDLMAGGQGGDLLDGGSGSDTADYSASGNGVTVNLATGTGSGGDAASDTLIGVENVTGSAQADTLTGDGGANVLSGAASNDSLSGGAGNDSLYGGADSDTLAGGTGNDLLVGGDGNDSLAGGADADTLAGDAGQDSLLGEAGNDSLSGGDGDDRLTGGSGDDSLTGGLGRDVYELSPSGGADIVTDFAMALVGNQTTDQLDVSDLTNGDGSAVKTFDVAIGADSLGNAVLTFPGGETLVLSGVSPVTAAQPGMLHCMGIPCFGEGTRIATPQGLRAVEEIEPGQEVLTEAGRAVPVLWHGMRRLGAADLDARPDLRPIRLKAGRWGNGRDLILSPQHALALDTPNGRRLVRARHLAESGQGARVMRGARAIAYHHLLLPRHDLILAEGVPVESFYPGVQALFSLTKTARAQLLHCLGWSEAVLQRPEAMARAYGPRCLPLAGRAELSGLDLARPLNRRSEPALTRV